MDYRILGPFEVYDGDEPVVLGAGKQRALLALLLLHANDVVPVDRLIDDLWGESPPPTAGKIVQNYVSQLRRALEGGTLLTRSHGYVLQAQPGEIDVDRFRALVEEGRRAAAARDNAQASGRLTDALGLWRGRALEDFAYEPFAQDEIARLEELRLAATMDRIDADLALGRHADLVGELETLIAQHPFQERLRGQLMLALYRSGRQADALHAYQETRRALVEELGIEPGQALQQLEKQILTQDPALGAPEPTRQRAPESAQPRPRGRLYGLIAAALLIAVGTGAAVGIVLSRGHGAKPITSLAPNSIGAIDPKTNKLVGEVAVGAFPRVAVGGGSVWVMNGFDGTVMQLDPDAMKIERTWSVRTTVSLNSIAYGAGTAWIVATSPGTLSSIRSAPPDQYLVFLRWISPRDVPDVAVGAGRVWVTSQTRRAVIAVDPQVVGPLEGDDAPGRVTRAHAEPLAIAVEKGAVWFTGLDPSSNDGLVGRIDPVHRRVVTTIRLPGIPSALAVGDGAVWVAVDSQNAVWRIDPRTNSVVRTIPVAGGPYAVAVGEGAVWVVSVKSGTVSRIDPSTNRVVATIPVGGSPRDVAVGESRVWVAVA